MVLLMAVVSIRTHAGRGSTNINIDLPPGLRTITGDLLRLLVHVLLL